MDSNEVIAQAHRISKEISVLFDRHDNDALIQDVLAEAAEFLRTFAGPKSSFFQGVETARQQFSAEYAGKVTVATLASFVRYIEAGLKKEIPPERQAQLDVVSDFLEQARQLLETKGVHPAAPTVLVGATLEEFLRTWIESAGLSIGNRKPGLEAYSQILRDSDLITKQDAKDIASWGGLRNHAAHGEWDEVVDKQRVQLMLEGVNLFMRKYAK